MGKIQIDSELAGRMVKFFTEANVVFRAAAESAKNRTDANFADNFNRALLCQHFELHLTRALGTTSLPDESKEFLKASHEEFAEGLRKAEEADAASSPSRVSGRRGRPRRSA